MGIKRIVDTSFWTDGKVDDFSPEDKYFMLYLLTNPFSTQLGIYEISIKQAAFQMGYSIDAFNVLLERFENKYEMILFAKETNEIAIKNFLQHSIIKGGAPVRDCLIKEMKNVKSKYLIADVFTHLQKKPTYEESVNETVKNIISEYWANAGELRYCNEKNNESSTSCQRIVNESYDNENDNENENDNDKENDKEIYISIVSYLNEKAKTNYKASSKATRTCIHARLAEGFTLEDFKTVIDKKCAEWIDTDFEKFLRPSTLFGTKFESYLNAKVTKQKSFNQGSDQTDLDELF